MVTLAEVPENTSFLFRESKIIWLMMGGSWEEDSSQFYNRKIGIIKRCLPSDVLSSSELDSSWKDSSEFESSELDSSELDIFTICPIL